MLVAWGLLPLLGASWARLGASWARPGGLRGPGGGSRGAPEAENIVKTTYFHLFCRVSGGPGNRSVGLRDGNFADFGRGGEDYRRGGYSLLVS